MATGRRKAKHPLRFRWWMLPIVLIAGYFGGKSVWEYFEMISGRAPMVHFTAKIQVGDEVVNIDKKIACHKQYYGELRLRSFFTKEILKIGKPFHYVSDPRVTGAHLTGGGALLIPVPKACHFLWQAMKKGQEGNVAPASYLPVTAVVDNFENPQELRVYASKTAYKRESARVKILNYSIEASEPYTFPSAEDEFDWRNPENGEAIYFSWALLEFAPVGIFREGQPDQFLINNVRQLSVLDDVPNYKFPEKNTLWTKPTLSGRNLIGTYPTENPETGATADEYSVDNFFPAVLEGDEFVAEPSLRGMLIFRRVENSDDGTQYFKEGQPVSSRMFSDQAVTKSKLAYKDNSLTLELNAIHKNGRGQYVKRPVFYDPDLGRIFRFQRYTSTFYHSP